MIRKTIVAVLSFVAVVLWGMYLSRADGGYWMHWGSLYTDRVAWGFTFIRGGLGIWYNNPNPQKMDRERRYDFRGFNLEILEHRDGYRYYYGRIPLWAPGLLASIYPTVAFVRGPVRRWRRRRKGLCLKCGYNLTGNMSGVCPECGEAV